MGLQFVFDEGVDWAELDRMIGAVSAVVDIGEYGVLFYRALQGDLQASEALRNKGFETILTTVTSKLLQGHALATVNIWVAMLKTAWQLGNKSLNVFDAADCKKRRALAGLLEGEPRKLALIQGTNETIIPGSTPITVRRTEKRCKLFVKCKRTKLRLLPPGRAVEWYWAPIQMTGIEAHDSIDE